MQDADYGMGHCPQGMIRMNFMSELCLSFADQVLFIIQAEVIKRMNQFNCPATESFPDVPQHLTPKE